jgi:hypothetical protein
MSGDAVRLAGTVKGNAFIAGRDIVVDGVVEGSLFAIGQSITINGSIEDSAYLVALTSRLSSTASIGQNLYFVGVSITTERASQVGRDLYGFSLGAFLQGSIGRDTKLIAGLLQFIDLFWDITLGPTPESLRVTRILERAPGLGQFTLPGDIVIDVVGRTELPAQTTQPVDEQQDPTAEWLLARLRDFLPLLIVGLIGYWFLRRRLEDSSQAIRQRPLYTLGIGLVGLILAGAVVGAFILVFVLILMVGIWVGRVTFWNVSWLLWSVAFPFTALMLSLFLVFLNHGTKVIAMYAGLTYVVDRFAPSAGRYRWLLLILGLVIYVFLRAIPILGWVIGVLVTAWGLGGAWLAWRERRMPTRPIASEEPPVMVPTAVDETVATETAGKDSSSLQ